MAVGWKKFTGKSQYPELTANDQGSAFTYGSKRDRGFRMGWIQGKRNTDEEIEIINWINHITSEKVSTSDPLESLHDGKILCKLLLRINPNSLLKPVNQKPPLFSASENVKNFIDSLLNAGFIEVELFEVTDLVEKRDFSRVCKTLQFLRERAEDIQKF